MPITLGTNIASLQAQRRLFDTGDRLSTVFERLASGQRINRASDDAAGLAIADSLNARSRIYTQGVRNLNDGLSLLNIADSSLESLSGILIRLEELAEQAANGVYGPEQRKAIDTEGQALKDEFLRISQTTSFNDQLLFTGDFDRLNLQGGIGEDAVLSFGLGGAIGTGAFASSPSSGFETDNDYYLDVELGDLNQDGILDLVIAGRTNTNDGFNTVRLGTGSGTFTDAISYAAESFRSQAITLGDINNDGILDMVSAGASDANYGYATVRLGVGDGTFTSATTLETESASSYGVTLGDLNGDGVLDLVTAGVSDDYNGYATVRLGVGDGTFAAASSLMMEGGASAEVTLGDVNGDGVLDLVTSGNTFNGSYIPNGGFATVRLGTGDGSFGDATSFIIGGLRAPGLALGDINNDGLLDLVSSGDTGSDGFATVWLGSGDEELFTDRVVYDAESQASSCAKLADLNGDGFLDLVTSGFTDGVTDGIASVRLGTGTGSFGDITSYFNETLISYDVALGDLDNDGVLDLITTGRDDTGFAGATIRLAETVDGVSPLIDFSLKTIADARQALPVFKQRRELLAAQRGQIGAYQSRIDVAKNVLQVSSENFRSAESQIRDADIALESANLVRLNILQQASAAVLAQANQQPALALQLLGGIR